MHKQKLSNDSNDKPTTNERQNRHTGYNWQTEYLISQVFLKRRTDKNWTTEKDKKYKKDYQRQTNGKKE